MHRQYARLKHWRRIFAVLGLLAVFTRAESNQDQQIRDGDSVLIVAGPGINSGINAKEKDWQLLYHVYQMFGTAHNGFKPTNVVFRGNEGRIRKDVSIRAQLDSPSDIRRAGIEIGRMAAQSRRSVLALDMDLFGVGTTVSKGIVGVALRVPLSVTGRTDIDSTVSRELDRIRTQWNAETGRAAIIVEQAAREFKKTHPDGKVILVGHSAFTNAIDQVPVKQDTQRLVDFRIISSPMVRNFRQHDPDHTIIVTHERDLPSANMGNIWSERSVGDLTREGTVLRLKSQSSLTQPHSETTAYTRVFDMDIVTSSGSQPFRGRPADVIRKQVAAASQGHSVSNTLIKMLERERPKESVVGGISLTKAAEVPLDPSDIRELIYFGEPHYRFAFLRKSGVNLWLPTYDGAIDTAAFMCVYQDKAPELHIEDVETWTAIRYIGEACLPNTHLGDVMLSADLVLASLAFGDRDDYRKPKSIANYHPLVELLLDHEAAKRGDVGTRVWLIPGAIRAEVKGSRIDITEIRMAVRFESYDAERARDYYAGLVSGRREPAGDFLAAHLTNFYDGLQEEFPALADIKEASGIVGVLIWARENGVPVSSSARAAVEEVYDATRGHRSGAPRVQTRLLDGEDTYTIPARSERKVTRNTIERPAVLFNELGVSRLLWSDGTESRIEYEAGRIARLVGRRADSTKVIYDDESRPIAMVGKDSRGLAVLWTGDAPLICERVDINPVSHEIIFRKDSRLRVEGDVAGVFQNRIGAWLSAQERDDSSQLWLMGEEVPQEHSYTWTFTAIVLVMSVCAVLMIRSWRAAPLLLISAYVVRREDHEIVSGVWWVGLLAGIVGGAVAGWGGAFVGAILGSIALSVFFACFEGEKLWRSVLGSVLLLLAGSFAGVLIDSDLIDVVGFGGLILGAITGAVVGLVLYFLVQRRIRWHADIQYLSPDLLLGHTRKEEDREDVRELQVIGGGALLLVILRSEHGIWWALGGACGGLLALSLTAAVVTGLLTWRRWRIQGIGASISTLPKWALVAFLARCARRAEPLVRGPWIEVAGFSEHDIDQTIGGAEYAAQYASHVSLLPLDDKGAEAHRLSLAAMGAHEPHGAAAAEIAAAAWYAAADWYKSGFYGWSPGPGYYQGNMHAAQHNAGTRSAKNGRMAALRSVGRYCAAFDEIRGFTAAVRRDCDLIARTCRDQKWTYETTVPSAFFGPLWLADELQNLPDDLRKLYVGAAAAPVRRDYDLPYWKLN